MFTNLNAVFCCFFCFYFFFQIYNQKIKVYHSQTPGPKKDLMQHHISQKGRINEVKIFCCIISPSMFIRILSPHDAILCQLLLQNKDFYCSLQTSLKGPATPNLLSIQVSQFSLKNTKYLKNLQLHTDCFTVVYYHHARAEIRLWKLAIVRLIARVPQTPYFRSSQRAVSLYSRRNSDTFPECHSFAKEILY